MDSRSAKTPHPPELAETPALPSPARGEGTATGAALVEGASMSAALVDPSRAVCCPILRSIEKRFGISHCRAKITTPAQGPGSPSAMTQKLYRNL
jgi:hypothetical protein